MARSLKRKGLQVIPGIGPSMERDLWDLGVRKVEDLKGRSPEGMYEDLMKLRQAYQDRCVLYVFRCAVYFASHTVHDPEKLKWWNWKDTQQSKRKRTPA